MSSGTESKQPSGALFAGSGVLTGLASLIGSSCCILPVLLVQAGGSAALAAHLGIFEQAKPYLMAATALFVLAGFVAAFWRGRRPRRRVLFLLIVAALLVVGAYVMPFYEREILDWMGAR